MDDDAFEQAKDWYQNRATRFEIAGVKIRLFNGYETITDEKEAFVLAVKDEQASKPLPELRADTQRRFMISEKK